MGKTPGGKSPRRTVTRLGTYGERVARERAARRRAARERIAHVKDARDPVGGAGEPELIEIPQSDLANELSVLAALIASGLARSHPEAKRQFRETGILVNGEPVLSDKAKLRLSDVSAEGVIKLSLGTKRHVLLRPV